MGVGAEIVYFLFGSDTVVQYAACLGHVLCVCRGRGTRRLLGTIRFRLLW